MDDLIHVRHDHGHEECVVAASGGTTRGCPAALAVLAKWLSPSPELVFSLRRESCTAAPAAAAACVRSKCALAGPSPMSWLLPAAAAAAASAAMFTIGTAAAAGEAGEDDDQKKKGKGREQVGFFTCLSFCT